MRRSRASGLVEGQIKNWCWTQSPRSLGKDCHGSTPRLCPSMCNDLPKTILSEILVGVSTSSAFWLKTFSALTKPTFLQKIADVNWCPIYEAGANLDVNKAYDLFLTKYKPTYDESFPVITKAYYGKSSPRNPGWLRAYFSHVKRKIPCILNLSKTLIKGIRISSLPIGINLKQFVYKPKETILCCWIL